MLSHEHHGHKVSAPEGLARVASITALLVGGWALETMVQKILFGAGRAA